MYHRNILVEQTDPEIFAAIQAENARQELHIELIASENYASPAVMAAQGSQLTNKYAEGYPGRRYYGGCEFVNTSLSGFRLFFCQPKPASTSKRKRCGRAGTTLLSNRWSLSR